MRAHGPGPLPRGRPSAGSRAAGTWRCCVSTRGSGGERRAWPRGMRSGHSSGRQVCSAARAICRFSRSMPGDRVPHARIPRGVPRRMRVETQLPSAPHRASRVGPFTNAPRLPSTPPPGASRSRPQCRCRSHSRIRASPDGGSIFSLFVQAQLWTGKRCHGTATSPSSEPARRDPSRRFAAPRRRVLRHASGTPRDRSGDDPAAVPAAARRSPRRRTRHWTRSRRFGRSRGRGSCPHSGRSRPR